MYLWMETQRKKLLAVSAFLLAVILILAPLLGVYLYRANSEACQQGLVLRQESQQLKEKLRQSQESFLEVEAQWRSCSNVSRDLNNNLEEMASQRDSLLSQLQKLKEENQNFAEKLRNAEAALQMEREKKNPEETSTALPGPQIYSLLLSLGLAITLIP
ncbi:bone marrow stromal antigen 2 [Phascolarctos cinereus]|uniref:Bone marrow stromal antigen 2 n=1 Tax=Phascolarctos cinereus TaxID=38626 RepID=A0A6P5ISH3_PHACI|nr:bone marrow stromal antigen 2 [Phascolarctos cinereus]